jgi:hypothetical protein
MSTAPRRPSQRNTDASKQRGGQTDVGSQQFETNARSAKRRTLTNIREYNVVCGPDIPAIIKAFACEQRKIHMERNRKSMMIGPL